MLRLGDVRVEKHQIVRVVRRGDRLLLMLRWPFEAVPVLFDLSCETLLSWHADDDPEAGMPVRTERWTYWSTGPPDENGRLLLRLEVLRRAV